MMRGWWTILLMAITLTVEAQPQSGELMTDRGDTLRYRYVPLASTADAPHDAATTQPSAKKQGFLRRVVDYFDQSAVDRTYEKGFDITFAGGPSYSKTTKLGLGLLGSGLYRLDRTDSLTPPSDLTLYANVATSGFYAVGVMGNTIFRYNRRRLNYDVSFSSSPRDMWGIGYEAGRHNPAREIVEQCYAINVRFLQRMWRNTYAGVLLDFNHTNGRDFDDESIAYINGQKRRYTATGIGLLLEYDSRDFIPNPARGLYVSVQETFYARSLGNCGRSLWRTQVTLDGYQRLWPSGLLAADLFAEFNSDGTPWTMLARLGGEERMRGYYYGRYTDNNMIVCQLELRQHLWRRFGCVVWGGAGSVFPEMKQFAWSEVLPNYGVGLRWELKRRVNVRMDYGFGRATSGFLLSINEAF